MKSNRGWRLIYSSIGSASAFGSMIGEFRPWDQDLAVAAGLLRAALSLFSRFQPLAVLSVVVLLVASMSHAQIKKSQDSDIGTPHSSTGSGAQTMGQIPRPMSVPTAQFFKNNPAAWSQFLSAVTQPADPEVATTPLLPAFGGTWQLGTKSAPNAACNPLLLTDGTVIVSNCDYSGAWYKLTPDITGSYVNGTWSQIQSMPVINGTQYAPLYFASAVLPDGRVIAMGGEYNEFSSVWTNLGAIYDPVANTWTAVPAPAGASWSQIGDAESTVLADGTFLLASCCAHPDVDALFDATNLTWTSTGAPNAGSSYQDEQGYTLLPNGNVLTIDIWTNSQSSGNATNAEQYDPMTGMWGSAGNTPVPLADPYACGNFEIGPAALRPDGTVVAFGGNTGCTGAVDPTAIFDSTTGMWTAGPSVPIVSGKKFNLADAPAAVLPNGNILFAASPGYGLNPTHFFEFTSANAINQVADEVQYSDGQGAYTYNFLVLPNGQIFSTDFSDQPEFYTPTGSPDPSWAPVISTAPSNVYPGTTYSITGTQLNGLSQGAYYGDDAQMATNYPIVQITNTASGHVFYGRTFNVSTRSIAPGASVTTSFTVPADIEFGPSSLVVIANGIPSAPVSIGVAVPNVNVSSSQNPSLYGQGVSFTATVTGASPSGMVQFNIDSNPFGSPVTLVSGMATSGTTSTLAAGNHTVTAVYSGDSNNAGNTGTLAGGQTVDQAPAITSASGTTFLIGSLGNFTVTTTGYPTPGISKTMGTLPSGVTFLDNGNGTGTLSGIPTMSGTFNVMFTASNGIGSNAVQGFTLTVDQPPMLTSANTATFTIGVAGSFTVTATGFPSPSITETGHMPTGLTFVDNGNGTGTLHGTPMIFDGGDFGISFTAQNGVGSPVTESFTIIVQQPPSFTSANNAVFVYGVPNSFTVTTSAFPVASIHEAGTLPSWLTFIDNGNGTATLSGTPSYVSGTFALVLTASNVVTSVQQNFTLDVSGLNLTPSNLSFGIVYLNSSHTLPVTVTNVGSTTVTISGVSITPGTPNAAAYTAADHCTTPLKAGKSSVIDVTFKANAEGTLTATLNLMDNAVGMPQHVSLTGNVIDPVAQFSPTKLAFGTQAVGSSTTLPVQLTNSGQTPLDISGISIGGADAGDFSQTNDCPAIMAAGASCMISVTFDPTVKGARTGTLIVSDNVASGESTVALAGTGH